jgi:hypothetical protein
MIQLPAGVIHVRSERLIPAGATLRGHRNGTVLRASPSFRGRALVVGSAGSTVENLTIDGNRAKLARPVGIPPWERDFIGFYDRNGLIADRADGLTIRNVTFRNIANFAVIVARSRDVSITSIQVEDSGSLNAKNRNNTTGGVLLEEGTSDFTVRGSTFVRIRGNGVWTHSRAESPRNGPGLIERNRFEEIGRDALQAGHATRIRMERNTGVRIGWPVAVVDIESGATPVAMDTAGNVDQSVYAENRFEEVNGKCIDLDGFHHGEVRGNTCINRRAPEHYPSGNFAIVFNNTNPGMRSEEVRLVGNVMEGFKYSGIFVVGTRHTITGNRLVRLNLSHCNDTPGCIYDATQPDMLRSGIYLAARAERPGPSRDNTVTDNVISGFGMDRYCIVAAPGIALKDQTLARNDCRNTTKPSP